MNMIDKLLLDSDKKLLMNGFQNKHLIERAARNMTAHNTP